jgi:hypothetical protein
MGIGQYAIKNYSVRCGVKTEGREATRGDSKKVTSTLTSED